MKALRDSSMSFVKARELLQSQKEKGVKCDYVHDMEKSSYWNLSAYWQLLLLLGTFLMSLLTALHDILLGPKKGGINMDCNMKRVCSSQSILRSLDIVLRLKLKIRRLREGRIRKQTLIDMCLRYAAPDPTDWWNPQKPFVDYFNHRQVEQLAEKLVKRTGERMVRVFFFFMALNIRVHKFSSPMKLIII